MLRYPGGKSKLKKEIISKLNQYDFEEYREPFFGGGSIGLNFIQENPNVKQIWINDLDLGIFSLWSAVINYPNYLKQKIKSFKPSVEAFDEFKKELISKSKFDDDFEYADFFEYVDFGFKKLAIHQISYSGLGTKSGGPLGGRDQKSNYKIDCRWSPDYLCKKIDILYNKFKKISIKKCHCTNLDFSELIENDDCDALIYLDPPYYKVGNDLYQHGFTKQDHIRLMKYLKKTNHKWVLSYDDCKEIRELYDWANIEEIGVNYTITALKDKKTGERTSRTKTELLITRKI